MQEVILFYNELEVPTRQILDSKGVIPSKTDADAKVTIQEMVEYSQKYNNGTSRKRSTKTSDGLAAIQAQLNNLGREIKKVNEKLYTAQVGCEQWGYRAAAPGFYQRNNANPSYQERRQYIEDTLSKFMSELAKRHKENSNMIKEIRASTNAVIRNQGASIKTLEIQIGQMSKVLQERGFGSLPSSTKSNPRDHVKSISTTVEANTNPIRHMGSSQYAVSTSQNKKEGLYGPKFLEANSYEASHINNSIPRKEKDLGSFTLPCYINNVCFDNAIADLGASISVKPLSTYLSLGLGELAHTKLTVELADKTVKYPKGIAKNMLVGIGKFVFPVDFIILDMPEDVKVPLILGRPFLSTSHAKIDVFKRKITLRVGDEKIIFKSMKPASSLIKRVYMLSLRERMELDLEARLMGETLVLNRSLDPLYGDYIELNDLNEPLKLRRDQVDDLMPTIEEGKVIDEPMIDIINTMKKESFDEYPSFCDFDRKIHIDCAYNLRFSCMIGFEHVNANFFPILSVNVMSREFYNSIIRDKVEYKGKNVVEAFMNVPIFVINFSVVTHFEVVENMDGYRDQDIGDIIHGNHSAKLHA
ncbi:mitochondrial proton/calcium exchanger protein-like protein isoform X1 [Tanacetum coccineum]